MPVIRTAKVHPDEGMAYFGSLELAEFAMLNCFTRSYLMPLLVDSFYGPAGNVPICALSKGVTLESGIGGFILKQDVFLACQPGSAFNSPAAAGWVVKPLMQGGGVVLRGASPGGASHTQLHACASFALPPVKLSWGGYYAAVNGSPHGGGAGSTTALTTAVRVAKQLHALGRPGMDDTIARLRALLRSSGAIAAAAGAESESESDWEEDASVCNEDAEDVEAALLWPDEEPDEAAGAAAAAAAAE